MGKFETVEEYIARGGKITIYPPAHPAIMDTNELKAIILLRKLEKMFFLNGIKKSIQIF